jgi:hypothetical protein
MFRHNMPVCGQELPGCPFQMHYGQLYSADALCMSNAIKEYMTCLFTISGQVRGLSRMWHPYCSALSWGWCRNNCPLSIATILFLLRIAAKILHLGGGWGSDDYTIIVAYVSISLYVYWRCWHGKTLAVTVFSINISSTSYIPSHSAYN